VFLRLLIESLRRGGRRKLLAAVAVALGITASTALLEVLLASGDRLAAEMGTYGANIEVVPAGGRDTFDAGRLRAVRRIFWRNNVVALAPTVELRARFLPAGAVAPVVGTWFDVALEDGWRTGLPAVRPSLAVSGRWPADGAAEVALGRRLAARLGARPGDSVGLELAGRRRELAVVGIVTGGGEEEEQALAPLAMVHALAGRRPGRAGGVPAGPVTRAEVFALTNPEAANRRDPAAMTPDEYDRWYCTAYPSSVAWQVGEALPDADARVVLAVTAPTAQLLGRLRAVLLAVAAVSLAGAALGVAAVMTAAVLERRLEAGLLVALGAEAWQVATFFLVEAALLGLAGGLAGGVAGLAGGRLLGRAVLDVAVPWTGVLLPVAAAAGVAVALVGGGGPVVRLLRESPALALRRAAA
jgi:putative ABC transport system permease protein